MHRRNPTLCRLFSDAFSAFFQAGGPVLARLIGFEIYVRSIHFRVGGARVSADITTARGGIGMFSPEGRAGYHGTLTDEFARSGNG
jgi:hypothetical protein